MADPVTKLKAIRAVRRIDQVWSNPKLKHSSLLLKEACNGARCQGTTKPFVNNTKELLEGKALKSYDLTHQSNTDFKRFDLIPDT